MAREQEERSHTRLGVTTFWSNMLPCHFITVPTMRDWYNLPFWGKSNNNPSLVHRDIFCYFFANLRLVYLL